MAKLTYQYIELAKIPKAEALRRARRMKAELELRFGPNSCTVQTCLDAVIDAAQEHAQ